MKAPVGGLGATPPPRPGAEPLSRGFSVAHRGTIKCNFTAAPQAGKERFLCLFQMKVIYTMTKVLMTIIAGCVGFNIIKKCRKFFN